MSIIGYILGKHHLSNPCQHLDKKLPTDPHLHSLYFQIGHFLASHSEDPLVNFSVFLPRHLSSCEFL